MTAPASRRAVFAWCLYDWGNSAFPTVIATFLFSAYFTTAVAPTDAIGTALWGQATALVGIAVALASPVLGAIADQGGRRKPWIGVLSAVSIVATALMWFVTPDPSAILLALMLYGIASFGFELALVFYNAMLPDLAPDDRLGRVSGWGWGLGYFGGLACLALSLALVQPDPAPFGLDRAQAEHARAVAFVVAFWYALFALPLFFLTPDRPRGGLPMATAIRSGLATLAGTLKRLPRHRNVLRFLIAKMLYIDGLNTLFAFGGIYAAGVLDWSVTDTGIFGILAIISGAIFAWIGGRADSALGPKPVIVACNLLLLLVACAILFISRQSVFGIAVAPGSVLPDALFYVIGMAIGAAGGVVQAASRTMMVRQADPARMTEAFGLYALSGKATSFLAPLAIGVATWATGSQQLGVAPLILLFLAGLFLLTWVKPDGDRTWDASSQPA